MLQSHHQHTSHRLTLTRIWKGISSFALAAASRFHDQYDRPDIIKRVLNDLVEDQAIADANRLTNAKPVEDIAKKLPPVIVITSPAEGDTFTTDRLTVRYTLRSPSGLPVSDVRALVDGHPLPGASTKDFIPVGTSGETEGSITLDGLQQQDVTLSLIARAGDLESAPVSVHLKFQSALTPTTSPVSLYALVVGVSRFKDPNVRPLHWAAKDARDFAAALKRQQGRLYRKVEVRLLADEDADNGSILDGLTWLQRQVSQGDVGVVFLSGHGVTDPTGDYYYVPNNAKIEDVGGVRLPTRSTSVPDTEISHALKHLACNALFFLDTCHSGWAAAGILLRGEQERNKFINEIACSADAIVLASSRGTEVSQERDEWKQGAFTKALLEGLAGAADVMPKDGIVTIDELSLYVKERVKELTGGFQHPVDLKPKEALNIPFAMCSPYGWLGI